MATKENYFKHQLFWHLNWLGTARVELFVKEGVNFSTYFRWYHPIIITIIRPTLTSVAVTLVAREAGALVTADVVSAVREHITGSENKGVISKFAHQLTLISHLYLHSFSSGMEHPLPPQPSLQWHWESRHAPLIQRWPVVYRQLSEKRKLFKMHLYFCLEVVICNVVLIKAMHKGRVARSLTRL